MLTQKYKNHGCFDGTFFPDFDKPFIAETDASAYAVGAVLLQFSNKKLKHSVAFYFRKMLTAKTNYSILDKEILAIIYTLKEQPHYMMLLAILLSSNPTTSCWNKLNFLRD